MFVVSFLDFTTFKIKILGEKETEQAARNFMYDTAKGYVLQKDGERNMVIIPQEKLESCDVVLGHFLCEVEQDCLDLYDKTQVIVPGYLTTSVSSSLKKLGRYQISEKKYDEESLEDFVNDSEFTKIPKKRVEMYSQTDKEFQGKFNSVLEEMVNSGFKKCTKNIKED